MMASFIDLLLSPVYLYQGKSIRKNIVLLPEPDGEREGSVGRGDPVSLLLTGDSSVAGVGASSQKEALLGNILMHLENDYRVDFRLVARSGARTRNMITGLKREPEKSFDIAVTALGVNDVTSGISEKEWISDQGELFSLLRERFQVHHILVSGLPPVSEFPALPQPLRWYLGRRARSFNIELERLCEKEGCHYISPDIGADVSQMAPDGFHPGPGIYKAWGEVIARTIRSLKIL